MDSPEQKELLRQQLRQAALEYHEFPTPGKISVTPTKQLTNQRDLALAYSPGVASPCEEIVADPAAAFKYTARGNLGRRNYQWNRCARFRQYRPLGIQSR